MRIELSSRVQKQLRKLKRNQAMYERINAALDDITLNPQKGKHLGGELEGVRSFRVGDWRILYEICEEQVLILVISIADRKEAYK